MSIKIGEKIALFQDENDPVWSCGIYTEKDKHHGNVIVFTQSFPHPLFMYKTESVYIREKDLDKVIEFLQTIKEDQR